MVFSEALRGLLDAAGGTAVELAQASGVSKSTVSRYLSGRRVPPPESENPARLAEGLLAVARDHGRGLDGRAVAETLARETRSAVSDEGFAERLGDVLRTFGVAGNALARSMDFDPSYISRILSGQRRPADLPRFIGGVASYVARNRTDADGVVLASGLTGVPADKLRGQQALASAIGDYLLAGAGAAAPRTDSVEPFLAALDAFDLNEFLKGVDFGGLSLPASPLRQPAVRTYEGIDQMKQAELDFIAAAVRSDSTDDVILYSDMPLGEMARDREFAKKVMSGMALLLRKGIHLRNIHDVHRPLDELIMGLEGWLPIYMTGQMGSYWLPQPTNDVFLHFIRSAGSVAASGEAIAPNQGGGRYVVTRDPADVAYLRRRAEELFAHARPLLRVWREDARADLDRALRRLGRKAACEPCDVGRDTFKNMTLTVWPGSHALIVKERSPWVALLVEHPALVDALERYEPTLF